MRGIKIRHMNKPLSLLFLATLSCGAISLAAYVHKDENKKDINQTVKAEAEAEKSTITFDYRSGGNCTAVSGIYDVEGGTITMAPTQHNAKKTAEYNGTVHYVRYTSGQGYGSGTLFTFAGVKLTKVTLTAHGSTYAQPVKYVIGDTTSSGTWSGLTMTIDGISTSNSFEFYNATTSLDELRIDIIELEYEISTDFIKVNNFATKNMHMDDYDRELTGIGDGLCLGANGYYVTAKNALVGLTVTQIDIFKNNSYFAKYHERYLAWAAANHDTSPYESDDNNLSNTTTIDKKNDNIAPLIVSISSFSLSFVILCSMLYSYKKEN